MFQALLYIAAEDEAFMAYNRKMDTRSLIIERKNVSALPIADAQDWNHLEQMPLAGKTIQEWLSALDMIAKEVEAELVYRDIGCHLVQVLEAVNLVLFELRGFKRSPVLVESKHCYLHYVLSSGCGSGNASTLLHLFSFFTWYLHFYFISFIFLHYQSNNILVCLAAILLSIIYIEVCGRLGLNIVGSRVGEDFLIWPQTGYPEVFQPNFDCDGAKLIIANFGVSVVSFAFSSFITPWMTSIFDQDSRYLFLLLG